MWQAALSKVFKLRDKVAMNLSKEEDVEKPFLEHLEDLRSMLVRMATTLAVTTIGTFFFYKELFQMILMPLVFAGIAPDIEHAKEILINIGPPNAFMTAVNVSLIAGVIVAFPLLLFFLLQFVLPGLKQNEKKLIFPALGIGAGLFATGVLFSYFMVLPRALSFFEEFGRDLGVKQTWTLEEYITFSTRFILIFGASFELPVLVMALVKLDFLSYKVMKTTWKHALVAVFIFAAVITPTQDVLTLTLLAGPLYVLYLICIFLAYFIEKKERQLYPEFYAERDKDEAELNTEIDDWDKEDYNPWDQSGDDEDDDDDLSPRTKKAAPIAATGTVPQEEEPAASEPEQTAAEPQSSDASDASDSNASAGEKTLEDLAREDENRSGSNPTD